MAKVTQKDEATEANSLVTPEPEDETAKADSETEIEKTAESVKKPEDDGRVDYVLPRYILSNDKYVTVTHNGVNYQIETGKKVRVPKGVAEILDDAIERKTHAQGEEEKLAEKML